MDIFKKGLDEMYFHYVHIKETRQIHPLRFEDMHSTYVTLPFDKWSPQICIYVNPYSHTYDHTSIYTHTHICKHAYTYTTIFNHLHTHVVHREGQCEGSRSVLP